MIHADTLTAPLLLYDHLEVYGGAERVLATLQKHWESNVCVGFNRAKSFGDSIPSEKIIDLGADHPWHPARLAKVLHAFWSIEEGIIQRYPIRLYAGSYSVLAHRSCHPGRAVYYCHTPPRFLYDLQDYYANILPVWQRPLLAALRGWFRPHFEESIKNMDVILANSNNVKNRLKKYLNVDAQVVYPPVDIDRFRWISQGDYFLSTSRLEPLKRVDILVKAFIKMPEHQLVVASGGSELGRLQCMAQDAPNIHFTGWIDDGRLKCLMGETRATLYIPKDEDFGMSPVESMAAGKPVIGVAEGGLLETVRQGETGILIENPDVDSVISAVQKLSADRCLKMRNACEVQASLFSRERFLTAMDANLYLEAKSFA